MARKKQEKIAELEAQIKDLERQLAALKKPNIDWESGMFSAISLILKSDKSNLIFERQHLLNLMPTRIDCLITKKDSHIPIELDVFRFFRKYNVIELKSYRDTLNVEVFWHIIGYAVMFRSQNPGASIDDIAISIFRAAKPNQLLKDLMSEGWTIEEKYHNIFYLSWNRNLAVQIVVAKDLGEEYLPLQILTANAKEEDVRKFIEFRDTLTDNEDRSYANSVLYACSEGNADLFRKLKEDEKMRGVLRDILKEDFIEAERKAERKATSGAFRTVAERMIKAGEPGGKIATFTDLSRAAIDALAASMQRTVAW